MDFNRGPHDHQVGVSAPKHLALGGNLCEGAAVDVAAPPVNKRKEDAVPIGAPARGERGALPLSLQVGDVNEADALPGRVPLSEDDQSAAVLPQPNGR